MDIVCPRIKPGSTEQTNIEYFRVYLVPKEQLETCRVTKGDMLLLNCDKPDQDVKFTFKFQEFSPNLWGLEFFKGKDYHIICKFTAMLTREFTSGADSWSFFTSVGSCSNVLKEPNSELIPPEGISASGIVSQDIFSVFSSGKATDYCSPPQIVNKSSW